MKTSSESNSESKNSETDNSGAERWIQEIKEAEGSNNRKRFLEAAKEAYRCYALKSSGTKGDPAVKANSIFWNTVSTILPYLFFNLPEPRANQLGANVQVEGIDMSALVSMSEKNLEAQQEVQDLKRTIEMTVEQWRVCSFGQVWVRYEHKEADDQLSVSQSIAAVDFVDYRDWVMPDYRNWHEVREAWFGRKISKTREEFRAEYKLTPDELDKIEFSRGYDDDGTKQGRDFEGVQSLESTTVYEIVDVVGRRRLFINLECPKFLKVVTDTEVKFVGGSPCPRPLLGTQPDDSVWPVVDHQYTIAAERSIKASTQVARRLTEQCKPKAVFDGQYGDELKRVIEGDAVATPLANWAGFAGQGGIDGAMDWVPIEQNARCLSIVNETLASDENKYYQHSGVTDLMRGIADPRNSEGTNSQIGVYGDKRTSSLQAEVARFIKDVYSLQYDVICDHFPADIILRNASIPESPDIFPTLAFLKNEARRMFAIDIETDSTLEADKRAEKQELSEFLQALMGVMQVGAQIMQLNPSYVGVVNEILRMAVVQFFEGRRVEDVLEGAFAQAKEQQQQQQQAQQQQAQVQQQQEQQMMAMQQQLQQMQAQLAERETKVNEREASVKEFAAQEKAQVDKARVQIEAEKADQTATLEAAKIESNETIASQKISDERVKHATSVIEGERAHEKDIQIQRSNSQTGGGGTTGTG